MNNVAFAGIQHLFGQRSKKESLATRLPVVNLARSFIELKMSHPNRIGF
jgi:hypothetical protein